MDIREIRQVLGRWTLAEPLSTQQMAKVGMVRGAQVDREHNWRMKGVHGRRKARRQVVKERGESFLLLFPA